MTANIIAIYTVAWLEHCSAFITSLCRFFFRGYNLWIMSTERDGSMNAVDFSSRAPSEKSTASKTKAPGSCVPPKRYLWPPLCPAYSSGRWHCWYLNASCFPLIHWSCVSGAVGEFQQWGGGLVECPAVSSCGRPFWSGAWRSVHHPLHGPQIQ